MTQLCVLTTMAAGATLRAAIDSGLLPAQGGGERIAVVANVATAPELVAPWYDSPAGRAVLSCFDRIVRLDEALSPFHPAAWVPCDEDLPVLERSLRALWALGDADVELVVDSVESAPSTALLRLFRFAPVTLVPSGLSAYGPTRSGLPLHVSQRTNRLLYLDVFTALEPLMLVDPQVEVGRMSQDSYRTTVDGVLRCAAEDAGLAAGLGGRPITLVIGQDLAASGALSATEAVALHLEMVETAHAMPGTAIVFKPHPSASPALTEALRHACCRAGIDLVVLDTAVPAEALAAAMQVERAFSCYSAALPSLRALYGVPIGAVGTQEALGRLTPFMSLSRIPATIVDALTRPEDTYRDPGQLKRLVETVAYCMQERLLQQLRPVAEGLLAEMPDSERLRYATRGRLSALKKAGALDAPWLDAGTIRRKRKFW